MIFSSYAEQKEQLAGVRLVSCGHVFAHPGREIFRPNGREDWLLFYVAKQSETFFLNGTVNAPAGSFLLFAPGEKQHHVYQGDKTAEFYYVHFKCDALPEGINLRTSHVYTAPPQQRICDIFEEIIQGTLQKQAGYEVIGVARLLHLLALLQGEIDQTVAEQSGSWSNVARAVQHMNRYCDSNLDLQDYAAMCCMSKYHFSRVFKEVTGTSPIEYRNRIRIEHAKELLQNGYLSVTEIGESLGYTSPSYFSDAFKKQLGISPVEYRKFNK